MSVTYLNSKNILANSVYEYLKRNNVFMFLSNSNTQNPNIIEFFNISKSEISLAYDRLDWGPDIIFQNGDIVLTSAFDVYKCISNNNNSKSLIKPSNNISEIVTYSDGYSWKFLYSLNNYQIENFLTIDKVPVNFTDNQEIATTERYAVPGSIDYVTVDNKGSGYSTVEILVDGDGYDAKFEPVIINGEITKINVINHGYGYTYCNLTITGNGSNATATAYISSKTGHGSNLFDELNVKYIMVSKVLTNHESENIPDEFEYNQVGFANKLYSQSEGTEIISTIFTGYKILVNSTNFNIGDEVIVNNTQSYKVISVEKTGTESKLFLSGFFNNISGNIGVNTEIKLKNNNTISANILQVMYTPNIRKNVNILYLESLLESNKLYKYSEDTYKIILNF